MATIRVKVDPSGAVQGARLAEDAIDKIAGSAHGAEAATEAVAKKLAGLKGSIDPVSAAVKRHESSVETLNAAYRQGQVNVDQYNDMLAVLDARLDKVKASAGQAEAATRRVGAGFQNAAGSSRRLSAAVSGQRGVTMAVQNASYQIGDFAVQVASGTSAVRAMTQQLPQLLGGFGVLGAVLGAAAAIGGALIPVFFNMGEEGKSAAEKISDAIKELNDELTETRNKADQIILGVKSAGEVVILRRIEELSQELAGLENTRDQLLSGALFGAGMAGSMISQADLEAMAAAGIKDKVASLNEEIEARKKLVSELTAERDALESLASAEKERAGWVSANLQVEIEARTEFANAAAEERAGYEASWEWWAVDEFKEAQAAKVQAIRDAQTEMTKLVAEAAIERAGWEAAFSEVGANFTLGADFKRPKSGGRAGPTLADQYDRLRGSLDPVFQATRDFADAQELLNKALAAGQITQAQYNETLGMARSRMDEALAGLNEFAGAYEALGSGMGDVFMAMVDGTKDVGDAFRSMAADVIGELYRIMVVQRLVGSVEEGTGILGWVAKVAGVRADGGPVMANKPYIVGERGPELFVPSQSGKIVPNGAAAPSVNIAYHFQGGVTPADLERALPIMVEKTKSSVIDAVQRGGAVARVMR